MFLRNLLSLIPACAITFFVHAQPAMNLTRRLTDAQRQQMLIAPTSITGESEPRDFLSQLDTWFINFNRRFIIEVQNNGTTAYFCMLVSTTGGYVAYLGPEYTLSPSLAAINPNSPDFRLTILSQKGQVLIFSNMSTGSRMKKQLFFGNTYAVPVAALANMERKQLTRQTGQRSYINNSIVGFPYKVNGATGGTSPIFYVHKSSSMTNAGSFTAEKFLGIMGVGYLKTNDGVYLSLGFEAGSAKAKVIAMDNENVMFDGANFECLDCDFINKARVSIRTGREKLLAERANITGPCAQQELERNQLKLETLNDHEQLLRDYGRSNAFGGDSVRTVTILDFQDPLIGLKEDLAKLKISLCNAQGSANRVASRPEVINCIRRRISNTQRAIMDMESINNRYPYNRGLGLAEKSEVYFRLSRENGECNY
jgi:hypothetical protein